MWETIVHPHDIARIYDVHGEAVHERRPYTLELRYREAATGTYHWHLVKGVPRFVAGQFAGMMGTGMSIHDRKIAEEGALPVERGVVGGAGRGSRA